MAHGRSASMGALRIYRCESRAFVVYSLRATKPIASARMTTAYACCDAVSVAHDSVAANAEIATQSTPC